MNTSAETNRVGGLEPIRDSPVSELRGGSAAEEIPVDTDPDSDADEPNEADFYRSYFEESMLGYVETDANGRILRINHAALRFYGRSRSELIGTSIVDSTPDKFRADAASSFHGKLGTNGSLPIVERMIVSSDGSEIVFSIEETAKRDATGRFMGLVQTLRDVTEIHRNESALRNSQRKARALFEGIEEAVFVHSLDGRILDANPAACRLLGYSTSELIGMETREIDDPDFFLGYAERLGRQLSDGSLHCLGRHRTKSGRTIPVEMTTSSIMLGENRAVLAVFRDISERLALDSVREALAEKNAELSRSSERYRRLTENCLDGVIVIDDLGIVTLFNPAAEQIFGFEANEVLGRAVSTLFSKTFDDWPKPNPDFGPWLKSREPALVGKTAELVGLKKTRQTFPLELSLNSVADAGQLQFIGSIRDQTEHQKMRAMLVQSDRLASIGLLSAGVAHEINNPLSYVGNNLAVLERDLLQVVALMELYEGFLPELEQADPNRAKAIAELAENFDWPYVRSNLPGILEKTRNGVLRITHIVGNLRGLARTSSPKMEEAKIADLFEGAIEMVRTRLRRHRIEVIVEEEVRFPLICVAAQISQVLLNLLVNAVQAVEARFEKIDGGQIRFRSQARDGMVILSLFDNGCGIRSENLPRLFDPFFTTKAVGEGTGLGLSICHEIITGHGGRIEVESEKEQGTTFRLILPRRFS